MCWEGKPASYTERAQSIAAGLAEYKLPLQTAFIFSQELQRAAMSHPPGKTQAGKKQQAVTFTPWQKLKSWSTGSSFHWRLGTCSDPKVVLISLPSFLPSKKRQRASGSQKFLAFYYTDKAVSPAMAFSDLLQKTKKKVIVTLGSRFLPNDLEGREHFQPKEESF